MLIRRVGRFILIIAIALFLLGASFCAWYFLLLKSNVSFNEVIEVYLRFIASIINYI